MPEETPSLISEKATKSEEDILLDQLQSEQGGRFLKKRNRNIIITVDEEIEYMKKYENFRPKAETKFFI